MEISNNSQVSWLKVKEKILAAVKEIKPELLYSTNEELERIEKENSLSGKDQSTYFTYYNDVSGFWHAFSRGWLSKENNSDIDKWSESSCFTMKTGNKVIIITLGGIIEYDLSDITKYEGENEDYYVNNAKVNFFNGITSVMSLHSNKDGVVNESFWANPRFNNNEFRLYNKIDANEEKVTKDKLINRTKYNFSDKDNNNYAVIFEKENDNQNGIMINLSGNIKANDRVFKKGKIYYENKKQNTKEEEEIYNGGILNLVPQGEGLIYQKNIVNEKESKSVKGIGTTIFDVEEKDEPYTTTKQGIINYYLKSNNQKVGKYEEKINQFKNTLNVYTVKEDNERFIGQHLIGHFKPNKQFIFNESCIFGNNQENYIQFNDEDNSYIFVFNNSSKSNKNKKCEVVFDNGMFFVGECSNTEKGLMFLDGQLFKGNKVVDHKKQTSFEDMSNISFNNAREITDKDLETFKETSKIKIQKENDKYNYIILSNDLDTAIINGEVSKNYLPDAEYLKSLLKSSIDFCKLNLSKIVRIESIDPLLKKFEQNYINEELLDNSLKELKDAFLKTKDIPYSEMSASPEKVTKNDLTSTFYVIKNLKILIDFVKKHKDKYNDLYNDYLVDKTNILQEQTNKKEKEYADIIKKSADLNKQMTQTISKQNDQINNLLKSKKIEEDKSKITIKSNDSIKNSLINKNIDKDITKQSINDDANLMIDNDIIDVKIFNRNDFDSFKISILNKYPFLENSKEFANFCNQLFGNLLIAQVDIMKSSINYIDSIYDNLQKDNQNRAFLNKKTRDGITNNIKALTRYVYNDNKLINPLCQECIEKGNNNFVITENPNDTIDLEPLNEKYANDFIKIHKVLDIKNTKLFETLTSIITNAITKENSNLLSNQKNANSKTLNIKNNFYDSLSSSRMSAKSTQYDQNSNLEASNQLLQDI